MTWPDAYPAVVFWPERIGLERLFQRLVERAEFVEGCAPLVRRLSGFGRSDPFSDGVSRKPGTLGYLMQRELVAEVHPPDFPQHFHADHPVFSCSKSEQKQLNTWVSFRSAATGYLHPCLSVRFDYNFDRPHIPLLECEADVT